MDPAAVVIDMDLRCDVVEGTRRLAAIDAALLGRPPLRDARVRPRLTVRQTEVPALLAEGYGNEESATASASPSAPSAHT